MRVITHRFLFKDVYKTLGIIFSFVGVLNLLIGCLLFYNFYNFFKDASNGVQGVQTRLKRKDRFESK